MTSFPPSGRIGAATSARQPQRGGGYEAHSLGGGTRRPHLRQPHQQRRLGPGRRPGQGLPDHIRAATGKIDGAAIQANARETRDWLSYGLDYAETRFSRLRQINTDNVKVLGLAWSYNLESTRGVEATPLVVDGIMYVTASWSVVTRWTPAPASASGPTIPRCEEAGYKGCCDVVNRGVALHKGKVYVGAYDGRLIALDAATGAVKWEKDTIIDRTRSYTITGAPRVFKGNVIIGNGGAEYGVRGYITAYDAETATRSGAGSRCRAIPPSPSRTSRWRAPRKTWDPSGKWWEAGGGGTVWDTMSFDPELNLMFVPARLPWAERDDPGERNLFPASTSR